jgi:hypothetical protein
MFALIEDGAVDQYPYNIYQLKMAHPNVSFPADPSDATLQEFGIFRVFFATPPSVSNTQVLEEDPPVFSAEYQRWTQVWRVRDMTEEEVQQRNDSKALEIRTERNNKLKDTVDRINPMQWEAMTDEQKHAQRTYRQALLDVPQQAGFPWTIEWPEQP